MSLSINVMIDQLPTKGRIRSRPEKAITAVVVHHDAAPAPRTLAAEMRQIKAEAHFHVEVRKWHCLGYHYVIGPTGQVYKCNPVTRVTAHARGANAYSIGVALQGNFMQRPPSHAQMQSLKDLLVHLRTMMPQIAQLLPHRRVAGSSTACPGDSFSDAMIAACWPA